MVEGRTTVARLVVPLNTLPPMEVTDAGMVTEVIPDELNALFPMDTSRLPAAKLTDAREEHR